MSTINAFISYSHQDTQMFETLRKHLTQLQRDSVISAWTDHDILAGGELDKTISSSLATSKLFIALLSPDYIASNYCYEREFQKALEMQEQGTITIVPVIVEPCDWQSTPFGKFKALPRDGKAVSTWENKNNAFLDVVQNLRKLANASNVTNSQGRDAQPTAVPLSRNYRVQKDFDSIEKIEFIEKTFHDVKDYLNRYMAEVTQLENIKARILNESQTTFESLLVNRNKIDTESKLKVSIDTINQNNAYSQMQSGQFRYSISQKDSRSSEKGFKLQYDDYHLFWTQSDFFSGSRNVKEFDAKEIAELMWNECLETVGIM